MTAAPRPWTLRAIVLATLGHLGFGEVFSPVIVEPGPAQLLRRQGASALYQLPVAGYAKPFLLADLHGSHEEIGFAMGTLLKDEVRTVYDLLFESLLGKGVKASIEKDLVGIFLDWQWRVLAAHTPEDYLAELRGIARADRPLAVLFQRAVAIAALAVGDPLFDIERMVVAECRQHWFSPLCPKVLGSPAHIAALEAKQLRAVLQKIRGPLTMGCSQWGAWGNRTEGGKLFSGRNLDWLEDTGMADYKLLAVIHPPPPQHAHVTVGFAGMLGALVGMNAAGISVHESGNDNTQETPKGISWTLRLRMIMEHAQNLSQVKSLWHPEDNTLGINHGIGSASDAAAHRSAFLMTENKAGYTAFFDAGDAREAGLVGPDGQHLGFPLQDALWRTNHGYDPEWLSSARHPLPSSDSLVRYMLLHDTIELYGQHGALGALQAVNLSAIVTDKGGSTTASFLDCKSKAALQGINTISAVFSPGTQEMWVSFEEGREAAGTHQPGGCTNYVHLDMKEWFSSTGLVAKTVVPI